MPELKSNFFPTFITGMTIDIDLASEEPFRPVTALFKFDSEEEVVRIGNSTNVRLAGYFFFRDIERVTSVAEALEVGIVCVYTGLISDAVCGTVGGVKESGFGPSTRSRR